MLDAEFRPNSPVTEIHVKVSISAPQSWGRYGTEKLDIISMTIADMYPCYYLV